MMIPSHHRNEAVSWSILLWILFAQTITALQFPPKAIVVTGANKGQGLALCQRILEEHDDTYVFLCARTIEKGVAAMETLNQPDRAQAVQLDVTDEGSVTAAASHIGKQLEAQGNQKLYGCVSNAGILWGYSLDEQFNVNARGVRTVLDAFVPLMQKDQGRMIVVSSGLGPLMHSFSSEDNKAILNKKGLLFEDLEGLMGKCLKVDTGPAGFEDIGFSGGPFADAVPDFHMYGLAKMMADAYMKSLGKKHPQLQINSCDPGLVYSDLILKMPKYEGQSIDETGAQTPHQGVEAAMRLLFDKDIEGSGHFYAMNKDKSRLLKSTIDVKPSE